MTPYSPTLINFIFLYLFLNFSCSAVDASPRVVFAAVRAEAPRWRASASSPWAQVLHKRAKMAAYICGVKTGLKYIWIWCSAGMQLTSPKLKDTQFTVILNREKQQILIFEALVVDYTEFIYGRWEVHYAAWVVSVDVSLRWNWVQGWLPSSKKRCKLFEMFNSSGPPLKPAGSECEVKM